MRQEAASAGFYKSSWGKHPRIRLLAIEDVLESGKAVEYRRPGDATFRRARRSRPGQDQLSMNYD